MIDPSIVSPAARPRFRPVGITKGPGETAHEYTFVSRDDEQVLKNGEYVYYELDDFDNMTDGHYLSPRKDSLPGGEVTHPPDRAPYPGDGYQQGSPHHPTPPPPLQFKPCPCGLTI